MGHLRRGVVVQILGLAAVALAACSTTQATQSVHAGAAKAGSVTATTGTTLPPGYTVPPATSPVPENCQSGSVTVAASSSSPPSPVCLHNGAMLTVVFDKSKGGLGVPGPWASPPVGMTPRAILAISSTAQSGDRLTAVFATKAAGTVTVSANFGDECAAGDTTPCTIPPESQINLSVTVTSP